ncbi:MAG: hypothetical protein R6V03_00750 [Kiritimatiellia bacterium]
MQAIHVRIIGLVILLSGICFTYRAVSGENSQRLLDRLGKFGMEKPYGDVEAYKRAEAELRAFKTNLAGKLEKEPALAENLLNEYKRLLIKQSEQKACTGETRLLLKHLEEVFLKTLPGSALNTLENIILDESKGLMTRSMTLARLRRKWWLDWNSEKKRTFLLSVTRESPDLKTVAVDMIAEMPGYNDGLSDDDKKALRNAGLDLVPLSDPDNESTTRLYFDGIITRGEYVKWLKKSAANPHASTFARIRCLEKAEGLGELTRKESQLLRDQLVKEIQTLAEKLKKVVEASGVPARIKKHNLNRLKQLNILPQQDIERLESIVRKASGNSSTEHSGSTQLPLTVE